jgi:hypothetical protein
VVISCLRDLASLLQLGPGVLVGVELEALLIIFIIDAPENYNLMIKYARLMVRNVVRDKTALLRNCLPLNSVLWVLDEFMNALNAKSPHVVHGSDLNVSSAVDIQVVIDNETAMVCSSLRQVSLQTYFSPFVS